MAITNSKQAADFLNNRAPKGESLAFINKDEARLLKANGGIGLPLPNTGGVPSYIDWGAAWNAAKDWAVEKVKNIDVGEWVDIGTKAWDTYAKYKDDRRENEQEQATYDKYLADTQDYERAAEIAIAENLTPMAIAKPALTKADITDFTLVKDGGIIGLKNGGRPGYMMGDMVMEETTMAAAPADVKESLNSIPPEMQAISQELFQKAVEELTEQELQMLMAYMQKAAMETVTTQAPMEEEETMVSETMMAANGGIMNAKRGLVDSPGGYAGTDLGNLLEDNRIVPEENESELTSTEIFEDGGDPSMLEISDEQSDLMETGEQYNKEYLIMANQIQERFPEYSLDQIIAEFQKEIAMETMDQEAMIEKGNLITGTDNVLKSITPESVQRIIQRLARGDTSLGNISEKEFTQLNSGGGAGIEALRKVRPDVVDTMGFNMGGRAMYNQGMGPVMDPSTDMQMASAPAANSVLNDMALRVYGKTLDQLTEIQIIDLQELISNQSQIQPQETGIMQAANGGRAMYAYGQGPVMNQGIGTMMANDGMEMLDMGGMEKDYRFNGGFVPMGEYEKKDDVPARLSKNEFVFTADAVRAAGGGSIQKGAKKMYDTMKNLEANV